MTAVFYHSREEARTAKDILAFINQALP